MKMKIPNDLKELYGCAQAFRHTYASDKFAGAGTVEVLIERIGQTEDETVKKACQAMCGVCRHGDPVHRGRFGYFMHSGMYQGKPTEYDCIASPIWAAFAEDDNG